MVQSCYDHLRIALTVLGVDIKQLEGLTDAEMATVGKHLKLAAAKSDELGTGHPYRGMRQSWPEVPRGKRKKERRARRGRRETAFRQLPSPVVQGKAETARMTPEQQAINRYKKKLGKMDGRVTDAARVLAVKQAGGK